MERPLHFDGRVWAERPLPDEDDVIYDLYAPSKTEVYAVGRRGLAVRWDGSRWRRSPTGTIDDLLTLVGAPEGPAWAGGAHGKMLRFGK